MSKRYSFDREDAVDATVRGRQNGKSSFRSWTRSHQELYEFLTGEFLPEYGMLSDLLEDLQRLVRESVAPTDAQTSAAFNAMLMWRRSLVGKPDPDAPPHWVDTPEIWELAKKFREAEKKNLDYNHGLPAIYVKLEPLAKEFRDWFQQRFTPEKPMTIAKGRRIPEKDRWGWTQTSDWTEVFRVVIGYYFWKIPYEGSPLTLDDFCEREVFSDTLKGLREKGRDRKWLQKHDEECARERREQGREGEIN